MSYILFKQLEQSFPVLKTLADDNWWLKNDFLLGSPELSSGTGHRLKCAKNICCKVKRLECSVWNHWVGGERSELGLRVKSVFVEENRGLEVSAGQDPKPCGGEQSGKCGTVTSPPEIQSALILVDVPRTNNISQCLGETVFGRNQC